MKLKNFICRPIYLLANIMVGKCRSDEEYEKLYASFERHFSSVNQNKLKAEQYEHIMSQKDTLYDAVKIVQSESEKNLKSSALKDEQIALLESDNKQLRYLIALVCQLKANEETEKLDGLIKMLSNQFLPN